MKKKWQKWLWPLLLVAVLGGIYLVIDFVTGNQIEVKEVYKSNQETAQVDFSWKRLWYGITFYLWDLSDGDLGKIQIRGFRDSIDIVQNSLDKSWRSAISLLPSLGFGVLLGVGLGALTFFVPDRVKQIMIAINRFLVSIPDLLLIALLQIVTIQLNKSLGELVVRIGETHDNPVYLLPILALGLPVAALMYIYTVNSCNETLQQEYVRTARAKGLPNRQVFFKHIFRPAADSILSVIPKMAGMAASSLVIVERLFNIQGLTTFFGGRYQQLQPVLMAEMLATLLILLAVYMIGIYLVTSLLRLWVNPALRK